MNNQSKYLCPICGADNMCTDFTDGFKWGRAYCNSCDCAGPEVRTGYEESLDAPWRTEARKQFADVANEYANKPLADDTNVARSPWVKTADRLPTEADADEEGRIPVLAVGIFTGRLIKMTVHYKVVSANTEGIKYFLPIPLLPEEENE